jgi:hypothetical protein
MKGINIQMTEWQAGQIQFLADSISVQDKNNKPGMLIAQIWIDPDSEKLPMMQIGLIDNAKSKQLQSVMGSKVGKVANGEILKGIAPID